MSKPGNWCCTILKIWLQTLFSFYHFYMYSFVHVYIVCFLFLIPKTRARRIWGLCGAEPTRPTPSHCLVCPKTGGSFKGLAESTDYRHHVWWKPVGLVSLLPRRLSFPPVWWRSPLEFPLFFVSPKPWLPEWITTFMLYNKRKSQIPSLGL